MDPSLDTEIRALLNGRRGKWPSIADDAGVSYSWICKFAGGRINNPGYATLKRLQESLRREVPPQCGAETAKSELIG